MAECPNCKTPCGSPDLYCHQCGVRLVGGESMGSDALTQKSMDLVEIHYLLGLVYFRKGQYQKALETWHLGLERDPGNRALQDHIAKVRTRLQESQAHPASGNPAKTL